MDTTLLGYFRKSQLPNNQNLTISRMKSIKNKFKRDPALASKYKETIKDYIDKGYAIKLTAEEASNIKLFTNYVPHHSVSNGNNSNKIRVVFDATAEFIKRTRLFEEIDRYFYDYETGSIVQSGLSRFGRWRHV